RRMFEEAFALFRQPGGEYALGHAGNNLARTLLSLGQVDRARDLFRQGLDYFVNRADWGYSPGVLHVDGIVWSLEGLVLAGVNEEFAKSAARLLGALLPLRDEPCQAPVNRWDDAVAALRATLGDERFNSAFESGNALTPDQAISELSGVKVRE